LVNTPLGMWLGERHERKHVGFVEKRGELLICGSWVSAFFDHCSR
jgi:hypothetical protein